MMKSGLARMLLLTALCMTLFTTMAAAKSCDEQREELRQKTVDTLEELYEKVPSAQYAIENCYGYAVLNNTGVKILVLGSAHGRGMAINNETGEEVFMRMQEGQVGLGLGVKEYALIFVIETPEAWDKFVHTSGWKASGAATAAANDGVTGDSLEGAVMAGEGIWVYQMTTKGLALELSIKGTRYYPDKKLNDPNRH